MRVSTWTVPGYVDIREIGRSRSGRTVLGRHTATGLPVTIKYLADDLRRDDAYLTRYRADARILADLQAPHVAGLYEYVESRDGVATVRPYVEGGSLRDILASSGSVRPEAALSVLKGGLLGLAAAHARGLTHRGYTPENLLVRRDGHTLLADFGLAPTAGHPADDVASAFAALLESLTGATATASGDGAARTLHRVPTALHGLAQTAAAGDGGALLADLDAVAREAYGDGWEDRGRRRLSQRASRLRQPRQPATRPRQRSQPATRLREHSRHG
jgi:serine/threonine-protein kinase